MHTSARLLMLLVLLTLMTVGCGSEPPYQGEPRYAVSGTVTFDGAPLENGTISFLSTDGKGNPAGNPITKGEFSVPENQGPNKGTYKVSITWQKPTGKQIKSEDTGEMVDVTQEAIPEKYNKSTELTAEVTDDLEKNKQFKFDLKK